MAKQKIKQFDIAIDEVVDTDSDPKVGDPIEINIPGHTNEEGREIAEPTTFTLNPPRLSRFMTMSMQYEVSDSRWELMQAGTTLVYSCLSTDEERMYLRRRFNNENDPFGLDTLGKIIETMTEQWSSRPTEKSSGSSPSPTKRGTPSTEKQPSQDETI